VFRRFYPPLTRLKPLQGSFPAYALVADVDPYVVYCLPHVYISKTKQDGPIDTMEHCYEVGTTDFVVRFKCCPRPSWGRTTSPFSGKHDQSTISCLRDINSHSMSAQQMICLGCCSGQASFLLQWRYICFIITYAWIAFIPLFIVDLLGRGALTNSSVVSGSLQRQSTDTLSSQKLLQIAILPSSVFIVLHNGWPLVVNGHAVSGDGKCSQTVSLMKLCYSAVASLLTEDNLIYLGTTSLTTAEHSELLPENRNKSSVAHFCIDLSELSTDEVLRLGDDGVHTQLIHPFSFLQLSSEDRMLYSRASPILDWHRKNQFCPSCGSVTDIARGGYKRVCQNTDCLTRKGHVFISSLCCYYFNPLECRSNYCAISNDMNLVHWTLMGGLLHLVQRGGDWVGPQLSQSPPCCSDVTAHPSTASVPITILLYSGPLLCSFNVPIIRVNLV